MEDIGQFVLEWEGVSETVEIKDDDGNPIDVPCKDENGYLKTGRKLSEIGMNTKNTSEDFGSPVVVIVRKFTIDPISLSQVFIFS